MTDLQRRGRRELGLLLAGLAAFWLPPAVANIRAAGDDWRALATAICALAGSIGVGWALWRGHLRARAALAVGFGGLGMILLLMSAVGEREWFARGAFQVYEGIGFSRQVALIGGAAVSLIAAVAVLFSTPLRAYWAYRRGEPGPSAAPGADDIRRPAEVTEDTCLRCGLPLPPDAACPSCGWTYQR